MFKVCIGQSIALKHILAFLYSEVLKLGILLMSHIFQTVVFTSVIFEQSILNSDYCMKFFNVVFSWSHVFF